MNKGLFVTFEGIDGAGKSSHIEFVAEQMRKHYPEVVVSREPGGTPLGEKLREILLHDKMHMDTEALLMFASRREHIAQVIQPALDRGACVISDRFTDSSFAYQGGGRKMDLNKLRILERWVQTNYSNDLVTQELQPDLTLLFVVPLATARERLDKTRTLDKFESEKETFFADTQGEYLRRAEQFAERFRIIDSSQSIEAIRTELATLIETNQLNNQHTEGN